MNLLSLPAFDDNYLWMLHDGRNALVVDPGDATPVIAALDRADLQLAGILVTHKHPDHVGGLRALLDHPRAQVAQVWGPAREPMPVTVTPVHEGDLIAVLGLDIAVLEVPGHTLGHLAYFTGSILFCGDTMFSGGCGRLFEGTPAQMHASLSRFAALPAETQVCCAHEYTLANLRFARAVEPHSLALAAYEAECHSLRERGLPTLPSTIGRERQINPYLRCDQPDVIASAVARGADARDPVSVLATIRRWKDQFR
ncbi:MAG: hydroxyacylglutathione hydrolase [Pseudomonadota bacterium]|jgi:hydroxyacylglutathione hydrolase